VNASQGVTLIKQALDACQHHWLLGQPDQGSIAAVCRKCGAARLYPAVLDDLDPGIETEAKQAAGMATAAGGARPSSGRRGRPAAASRRGAENALPGAY
jgi:hypothetical protein